MAISGNMENKPKCKSSLKLRLTDPVRRFFAMVTAPVALGILIRAASVSDRNRSLTVAALSGRSNACFVICAG